MEVKKPFKWKVLIKYIILLVLAVAVSRVIFFRNTVKTLPVKKIELVPRVVEKTVSASGEIKSAQEIDLAFATTGNILDVAVGKGDTVTRGLLVATLDNASNWQTLQSYKDAWDVTKRDIDLFVENYATNLQAAGGADEYVIQLRRLRELESKARATYNAALETFGDTYIYAPFDGTIVDIKKDLGEYVSAGTAIIRLANLTSLFFEITLDQEDYGLVREGQEVTLNLDTYANRDFKGKVTRLPSYANGGDTPNFTLEITLEMEESVPILLGMTGDAHIIVGSTNEPVPSLIYDEIYFDEEDKPFVWTVQNGLITKTPMEIGLEGDIYSQVTSQIDAPIVVGLNTDIELKEGFKARFGK